MNQLLKPQMEIYTETGIACRIEEFLGGGGQGEVYRGLISEKPVAVKWYFPEQATPVQRTALTNLIQRGAPNNKFLWPISIVSNPDIQGFGYVMPLRDSRFKGIVDLMKRRVEPTFWTLITAGFELADSFFQLHAKGLCYRDMSFGNAFFDPQTGEVLICDNDNVTINGQDICGVLGTPRFMAPEVVRGEIRPCTQTDLFSLSVLLFYLLMVHHPLEGKQEASIRCFDQPAMKKLYGTNPIFVFDPQNDSNRPVPGYHDNALDFWPIYPEFLRKLFVKAFTDGIHDPQNGRVRESEWRMALLQLRDSVLFCSHCGEQNFYDMEQLKQTGSLNPCWSCKKDIRLPPRIRMGNYIVMLNHNTRLFPHHINPQKLYDLSEPVAEVTQHPSNPNKWGIKNLSNDKWTAIDLNGSLRDINPGNSIAITNGIRIKFGITEGQIRAE